MRIVNVNVMFNGLETKRERINNRYIYTKDLHHFYLWHKVKTI